MQDYTNRQVTWIKDGRGHTARILNHIRDGATSSAWLAIEDGEPLMQWVVKVPFSNTVQVDVSGRPFVSELQVVEALRQKYQQGRYAPLPEMYSAKIDAPSNSNILIIKYYPVEQQAILALRQSNVTKEQFLKFAIESAKLFSTCIKIGYRNTDIKDENFFWAPDQNLVVLDWNRCTQFDPGHVPADMQKEMERLLVQVLHAVLTGREITRSLPPVIDPSWDDALPRTFRRIIWDASRPAVRSNFDLLLQRLNWWRVLNTWDPQDFAEIIRQVDELQTYSTSDNEKFQEFLDAVEWLESLKSGSQLDNDHQERMKVWRQWANAQLLSPKQQLDRTVHEVKKLLLALDPVNARNMCETWFQAQAQNLTLPVQAQWELGRYYLMTLELLELSEVGELTIIGNGREKARQLIEFWESKTDTLFNGDVALSRTAGMANKKLLDTDQLVQHAEELGSLSRQEFDNQPTLCQELSELREGFQKLPPLISNFLNLLLPPWEADGLKRITSERELIKKNSERCDNKKKRLIDAFRSNSELRDVSVIIEDGADCEDADLREIRSITSLISAQNWYEIFKISNAPASKSELIQVAIEYARGAFNNWLDDLKKKTLYRADYEILRVIFTINNELNNDKTLLQRLELFKQANVESKSNDLNWLEQCRTDMVEPYQWNDQDIDQRSIGWLITLVNLSNKVEQLDGLERRLSEIKGELKVSDITSLRNQADQAIEEYHRQIAEAERVKEKLNPMMEELKSLENQIRTLQSKIGSPELQNLQDQINKLKGLATDLEESFKNLSSEQANVDSALNPTRVLDAALHLACLEEWDLAIKVLGASLQNHEDAPLCVPLKNCKVHLEEIQDNHVMHTGYHNWLHALKHPTNPDSLANAAQALQDLAEDLGKPLYDYLCRMHLAIFNQSKHTHWSKLLVNNPTNLIKELEAENTDSLELTFWRDRMEMYRLALDFIGNGGLNSTEREAYLLRAVIPYEILVAANITQGDK